MSSKNQNNSHSSQNENRVSSLLLRLMFQCSDEDQKKALQRLEKKQNDEMQRIKQRCKEWTVFANSGLNKHEADVFKLNTYVPRNKNQEVILDMIKRWEPSSKGFFLLGKSGLGKSHLAKGLLLKNCNKDFVGLFKPMSDFVSEMNPLDTDETNRLVKQYRDLDIIVFDDLGSERVTDYAREKLFMIVDNRINSGKCMVFTSNLDTKKIVNVYGTRFFDRMLESTAILEMDGESYRKVINRENVGDLLNKKTLKTSL